MGLFVIHFYVYGSMHLHVYVYVYVFFFLTIFFLPVGAAAMPPASCIEERIQKKDVGNQ